MKNLLERHAGTGRDFVHLLKEMIHVLLLVGEKLGGFTRLAGALFVLVENLGRLLIADVLGEDADQDV